MNPVRWTVSVALVVLALVLQVSLFPHLAQGWMGHGVVPNLCLLVVVAAALVRGPEQAAVLGFVAGVLLDLAPPADHVAGRWALALVLVGYVAGRMRPEPGSGDGSKPSFGRVRPRWSPRSRPRRSSAPRSTRSAVCCCRTRSSPSVTCCP